jgi:hypothetical protein
MDWIILVQVRDHGNEPSDFVRGKEFLREMSRPLASVEGSCS